MNTNFKVSCEDQDLNPKQETSYKEVFNYILYILSTITIIRDLCKLVYPELAWIFQSAASAGSLECRKILNLAENNMVIQPVNVPLQPLFHHIKACKQNLFIVGMRVYEGLVISEEIWE